MDFYRDINSYIRPIFGETHQNRYNPFGEGEEFTVVDYNMGPPWLGTSFNRTRNVSYDSGDTFALEDAHQLFGAYFFLSEDIMINSKNIYSVVDLLSDFGGLYQMFVISLFYIVGSAVNNFYNMGKVIRGSYYVFKPNIKNTHICLNVPAHDIIH